MSKMALRLDELLNRERISPEQLERELEENRHIRNVLGTHARRIRDLRKDNARILPYPCIAPVMETPYVSSGTFLFRDEVKDALDAWIEEIQLLNAVAFGLDMEQVPDDQKENRWGDEYRMGFPYKNLDQLLTRSSSSNITEDGSMESRIKQRMKSKTDILRTVLRKMDTNTHYYDVHQSREDFFGEELVAIGSPGSEYDEHIATIDELFPLNESGYEPIPDLMIQPPQPPGPTDPPGTTPPQGPRPSRPADVPEVRRGLYNNYSGPSRFYSLWLGNSPVYLCRGPAFDYLYTTRQDTPLEIRTVPISWLFGPGKQSCVPPGGFRNGSFYIATGQEIVGLNQNFVADIFEQVMLGVEILPRPNTPEGYIKREPKGEPKRDIEFRHWGQVYLAQQKPLSIHEGDILGSGGSYKAYHFPENKTVVEFDQTDRATYFFRTDFFNSLRIWSRSEILTQTPAGFEGRAIHHENRATWEQAVINFLI
jgi:hypothetical protein